MVQQKGFTSFSATWSVESTDNSLAPRNFQRWAREKSQGECPETPEETALQVIPNSKTVAKLMDPPPPIRNVNILVSFPKENCTFPFSCFSCASTHKYSKYVFLLNFVSIAFTDVLKKLQKKEGRFSSFKAVHLQQQSVRTDVYF